MKKKLLNLSAIILGVFMCLGFNKVQAANTTFNVQNLTRENLQSVTEGNSLRSSISTVSGLTLGITDSGYKTNNGEMYWTIKDSNNTYKDLYCLNLSRGFGAPYGAITDSNSTKDYPDGLNLEQNYNYTGLDENRKDKVIWILKNSITSNEDLTTILKAASNKVDVNSVGLVNNNIEDFIKEDMKSNNRESTKLTFNDIKMVQQIAVWHYTNSSSIFENNLGEICNSTGTQISGLGENINTDGYGTYIRSGLVKKAKLIALYQYFIDNASSTEETVPTLTLNKDNATVQKSGNDFITGPFSLAGTNADLITSITATVTPSNYKLLDKNKNEVSDKDFSKVIGENFYIKVSNITQNTSVNIGITYKYNTRILTLLTDISHATSTQPVVLIEPEVQTKNISTSINIALNNISVEKIWDDSDNKDNVRPTSIKVALYEGDTKKDEQTLSSNNSWKYTWTGLLSGNTYSVKELKSDGTTLVVDGGNYNSDYKARYTISGNKTTITNKHTPEQPNPDLALRKYITKIGDTEITNRVPVITDTDKLDNNNAADHTAVYTHPKNALEVEKGKTIEYSISIYNEGKVAARASKITDQIPAGLKFVEILSGNYEVESYNEVSNILVLKETSANTDLGVFEKGKDLKRTTIIVKCEVLDTAEENVDLTNIAWISEMKKENDTFTSDIDSQTTNNPECNKDSHNYSRPNQRGYYPGFQDDDDFEKVKIITQEIPEKVSKTVKKVWEDSDNIEGIRPNSIDVQLYKNGRSMGDDYKVTLNENNNWKYTWENLDKIENENTIIYSVRESGVPDGYTTRYSSENYENVDEITITNTHVVKKDFDLALRKFITAIKSGENAEKTYDRAPEVDETKLRNGTATTATYKHTKQPLSVQKGDIVTYTIRVYNESKELSGYVNKIADHLPKYLIPILGQSGTENYTEEIKFNDDRLWTWVDMEKNIVSTTITAKNVNGSNESGAALYNNKLKLEAFEGREELDFIDVQIKCLVKDDDNLKTGTYLTNIAEIVDAEDINGEHSDGKDSALDGLKNGEKTDTSDLNNYKNDEAISSDSDSYIEGQEDDDDFEKLIVDKFDLALRKYITKVGNTTYNREPQIGDWTLDNGTTTEKMHSKNPLTVKKGDIITYTLRIYNEGTIAGKAKQVIDYIPEGLEFVEDSSINQTYGWTVEDGKLVTSYLDDDNKEIEAVATNNEGEKVLDYQDVQIQLKVTADPKEYMGKEIINYAEIGEDSNNDIDSKPGDGHGEKASKEDDDDYEPVVLGYFDLALRKFITKVNTIDYNNRIPEVDTSKYGTLDENGKVITTFDYKHTKDPVVVETGSTVVYTIRVYNEGSVSGYATELTDNIPEGLEFLPNHEINDKEHYNWKMLDEQGNETTDVTKAKKITTNYLDDSIIDAHKKENGTEVISHKDVKVAFKVTEPNTSDRLIINTAEISKASDEDIDSKPGNNDLSEDDIDREYLKVKYFDLSLKKWVTETRVTYNGKTKTKKTGFNENSTEMAKVDLATKKLKKTTVKFVYKIKVTNEGEVAGYASEIEDYIPKGLKFVKADNPKWTLQKNNVAVTDQLKDTLLQPGESATVEIVLTWKNSSTNMGVKTNWAEIKSDSGDDIDSIPDNKKKGEDDIDDAKVILSIKTGSSATYIVLILTSVAILAGGTFAIKKYVINK